MVRFQFKQKDAINAKILKDIKFPLLLDTFDLCSEELQQKLVPMRSKFKVNVLEQSVAIYPCLHSLLFFRTMKTKLWRSMLRQRRVEARTRH